MCTEECPHCNKIQIDRECAQYATQINSIEADLYVEAVNLVRSKGRATTQMFQFILRIGYGRARALILMMQRDGIISYEAGSEPPRLICPDAPKAETPLDAVV